MHTPSFHARAFICALLIAATQLLQAGQWHYGDHAVCSDCHTQHNSSSGQPMRTDNVAAPAPMLLLRATAQELCLSCHDGSNPNAPDVIAPVGYTSDPLAGSFPALQSDPSTSHHLLNPTPEVPPGGTIPMVLTCTTCHDPHGNDNYRNLRPDPTHPNQAGVTVNVKQTVTANGANPTQVYVPSNVFYKSEVSRWCETCHGAPTCGDHPVDTSIWGAMFADYTTWSSVTLPRSPVHTPTDDVVPSHDDQVMCLSCHKAHGSEHPSALIYADGASIDSTCQECHNQ